MFARLLKSTKAAGQVKATPKGDTMGLFDNLLKNVDKEKLSESLTGLAGELKKVAEAVNEAIPDDAKQQLKQAFDEAKDSGGSSASSDPEAVKAAQERTDVSYASASYEGIDRADYDIELPEDSMDCKAKLMEVIAADFPQYDVYEDVSPVTLGGTGRFMNYSLGLYEGGLPKLFIMIIGKTTTRHREYRWSKEQAAKAGVPLINFIGHAPNRYWYIKERLGQYL